jgi:NAD(P)-dependent dehydrogenase (short-subunit alcohol dehydrogenase family)
VDTKGNCILSSLPVGFRAVVIGASGGIGSAICDVIADQPHLGELVRLSRSSQGFDLTDENSIAAHASHLRARPIHLLICATGVLTIGDRSPEKALKHLDPEIMAAQFATNTIGPALIAKHFLPLLERREKSTAAFLSARVGSIGDNRLGGWISYRSSKAALNQVVRTAAIEMRRTHPQAAVVAVHPGTVRTRLSAPYSSGHPTLSPSEASSSIMKMLGQITPDQTGKFFSYDGREIEW